MRIQLVAAVSSIGSSGVPGCGAFGDGRQSNAVAERRDELGVVRAERVKRVGATRGSMAHQCVALRPLVPHLQSSPKVNWPFS